MLFCYGIKGEKGVYFNKKSDEVIIHDGDGVFIYEIRKATEEELKKLEVAITEGRVYDIQILTY